LFLNLSIGEIGEDNSALLGAMMITKIQLAAMRRTTIPEDDRRDFYLYVDEFQNFATESFATILSEARKYHLNLIMTNQYIAQVPEEVISAVFGNIGTLICFRVGAPDAVALKQEFAPVFEEVDLVNLDNYHIYVKMSIDGVTSSSFSAVTLPPDTSRNFNKDKIIQHSREYSSKRREYVEEKISNLTEMPKIDEILTKAQKDRVLKIPPKIGETYYREVQATGDERWYLGSGSTDQPLSEEVVQEKIAKHNAENAERQEGWQKERLKALEVKKPENETIESDEPNEIEKDKADLIQHLEDGKSVKL
ncbi:MAG: hypothetical protein US94_C0041G0001, partial [Berkelbacteria bacterium GW2011_GWB1_38_5]